MQTISSWIATPFRACWQLITLLFEGLLTIVASAYLLFLYVFTIWLVVGSLSAIQVLDDLPDDSSVSFASVEEAMGRLDAEGQEMLRRLDAANVVEIKKKERHDLIRRIAAKIGVNPRWESETSLWELSNEDYETAVKDSDEFQSFLSDCRGRFDTKIPTDANCQLAANYIDTDMEYELVLNSDEPKKFELLRLQTLRDIYAMEDKDPLAEHFDMFRFFRFLAYDTFLQEPPQILVLQVTLAMGMLGSIVSLTWSFIRSDSTVTLRRFLLMPFVGMMSAFIILVLVKAGQITITSGNANDSLSPFFLSFVGIISGLLSERAYIRISEVGSNFFSVKDDQPRYGVRLRAALDEEGIAPEELGRRLNMAEADISSLLSQTRTASLAEQNLIAAYLRRNVRDIFTDLPPVGAPEAGAGRRVPRLIGTAAADAGAALASAGLALGNRTDTPATGRPPGEVVSQSPAPDEWVAPGTPVSIEVSAGEPS